MTQPTPRPVKTDKRAKISHEQREEIVRRRAAGESLVALASEFGISRQRVDVIAKRQKAPQKRRPKLTRLTPEQQDWLHAKITQSKRTWTLASIDKLILKQFSIHLETAAYMTWLVELGVKIGDYDENVPLSPEFEAYLRSEEARNLREREAVWQANQPAYKPRLGRPRKNPLPPTTPSPITAPLANSKSNAKAKSQSLALLDDFGDEGLNLDDLDADSDSESDIEIEIDDSVEALSLEEMLASVEATRKKLAAAGRPVPPVSAWGLKPKIKPQTNALGQRLGKHAKASQPAKKNKKKKRKKR